MKIGDAFKLREVLLSQADDIAAAGINGWGNTMRDAEQVILRLETAIAEKDEAIRKMSRKLGEFPIGESSESGMDWQAMVVWARRIMRDASWIGNDAMTQDSEKVLLSVPEIMLLRDIIGELLDVQNGCPLPKYREAFDAANAQAREIEEWIDSLLKANGC